MALQRSYLLKIRLNPILKVVNFECNNSLKIRNFQTQTPTQTQTSTESTLLQRWGKYWKNLFLDYKDVALDVVKEFRERPARSFSYVFLLGGGYYLSQHNPDTCSYRDQLLQNQSKLTQVGSLLRNPDSEKYLNWVEQCYNEGIIRRLNLGIISFIWIDNFDEKTVVYKATCSYLKPRYITFYKRIIDIGFIDKWWLLEHRMQDYDVNISQFSSA